MDTDLTCLSLILLMPGLGNKLIFTVIFVADVKSETLTGVAPVDSFVG